LLAGSKRGFMLKYAYAVTEYESQENHHLEVNETVCIVLCLSA